PRRWSYAGSVWTVPSADRRIGSAWQLFAAEEPMLPDADAPAAFASLVTAYPEVQDWVAPPGHGGATPWTPKASAATIADLVARSSVVVVQLHAGFQFQEAGSRNVQEAAHAAIDAGASIVIGHHPHVLQGLEWYKGKLIAYSLGNLIFDQDFLST